MGEIRHIPDISIVIPCYREEKYIKSTLKDVRNAVESLTNNYEIIVIVDGVVDRTSQLAKKLAAKSDGRVAVYVYKENRGKGFALRAGFDLAKGRIVGFIDADGQIDAEALGRALKLLRKTGCDAVIGSKSLSESKVSYTPFRSLVSSLSQLYIKMLFGLRVSDTQAGLKVFKGSVIKKINSRLLADRFVFDLELLSVCNYLGFKDIKEIPIKVKMLKEDNTGKNLVLFIKDVARSFFELFPVFLRLVSGYYKDSNNNRWKLKEAPEFIS